MWKILILLLLLFKFLTLNNLIIWSRLLILNYMRQIASSSCFEGQGCWLVSELYDRYLNENYTVIINGNFLNK